MRVAAGLRALVVVALVAIGVAVLFAASLSANATLFGGAPDLVCVVVVSIALLRGPEVGALAGFGAGLALDALTWQPLGLAALVYCLVAYCAGSVGERLSDHAPLSPLIVVAVASLLARAGLALLGFLLGSELSIEVGFSLGAFPSAALDVLLAIPLYALLRRGLRTAAPAGAAARTCPCPLPSTSPTMFLPSSPEPREQRPQTPQLALRVAVLGAVGLFVFAVLVFRLWALQVLASDTYRARAQAQQVKQVSIPAARGDIVDLGGSPLVSNRPSLELQLDPSLVSSSMARHRIVLRLAKLIGADPAGGLGGRRPPDPARPARARHGRARRRSLRRAVPRRARGPLHRRDRGRGREAHVPVRPPRLAHLRAALGDRRQGAQAACLPGLQAGLGDRPERCRGHVRQLAARAGRHEAGDDRRDGHAALDAGRARRALGLPAAPHHRQDRAAGGAAARSRTASGAPGRTAPTRAS